MTPTEALSKARELTHALTLRRGEVGKAAAKILTLLDVVAAGLPQKILRPTKKGIAKVEYRVEMTSAGETLAEIRTSGASQPFRCPRTTYEALVGVLAQTTTPLSTDDLTSALEAKLGQRPADFQLRVPLRLWMHVSPPLVTRSRARYRPVDAESFAAAAARLWGGLI